MHYHQMVSISTAHVDKTFHLPSRLHGKGIDLLWFGEFDFFLRDIENEVLFCYVCHK